jgi:hypothetical protein
MGKTHAPKRQMMLKWNLLATFSTQNSIDLFVKLIIDENMGFITFTQLMSCVHGPHNVFENKASECMNPNA